MITSHLEQDLAIKVKKIQQFLSNKVVVVAFSGGVDSTVVMELSHRYAKKAVGVIANSITVLPGEVDKAIDLASTRGYNLHVKEINELEDENFAKNPHNRCYFCKAGLAEALQEVAEEINADIIVEGTNVSEVTGHRPGLKAIRENEILSPLLEFELTKENIRQLARYFDLPNAEKPSLACLSSRFPTGVRITPEKLKRLGLAERYLIDTFGIEVLRVRDHDGLARIEVGPEEREKLLKPEILDQISFNLKSYGFQFVSLDCSGYKTGSLSSVNSNLDNSSNIRETDIKII